MDPISLIIASLVFGAVVFGLLGLAASGQSQAAVTARQRLEGFKRAGAELEQPQPVAPFTQRVVGPIVGGLTGAARSLLPTSMLKGVERQLIYAGEPMNMQGFLTMVVVSTAASVGFGLMLLIVAGASLGPIGFVIAGVLALVGIYLPFYLVGSRARQRQNAIIKSLPDAFDLVTTSVEAGLGLDAALTKVSEKVKGPFAEELKRALRDITLGKQRRDALKELGERTGVPDLITFVNAVIQAEAMGSSIGQVLRVQADQLRVRRRQRAEEAAYKAPVKMLFPLVLCIFPTLFIVILGPAVITVLRDFPA
ncbi:MAG TPA: type II secretion system F family protein [Dehalococcoidia bacterium]|nr:type II secretion system F family protein [Dehalococcoidia bacterium]